MLLQTNAKQINNNLFIIGAFFINEVANIFPSLLLITLMHFVTQTCNSNDTTP